jgi:predicted nucleic acid-binding protein
MVFKVFLDANAILDFTLKRKSYGEIKQIIQWGIDGELTLVTTPSVIHITAYWLTRQYGSIKAKQLILSLLNDVHIIDCNHETALLAVNSQMSDIEDALQYYTAITNSTEYFISGDQSLQKAAIPQLPVLTASEFLIMQSDNGN